MKKILLLAMIFALPMFLIACDSEVAIPDEITIDMENFDELFERTDVQFIDLRNFDDKMRGGFIEGFTIIPFFGYLEFADILVRDDGWSFSPSNIKDERALRNLFNEDAAAIVLICAAGVRAGFVKSALEELGYDNVHNAGALGNYNGARMVRGDDTFRIVMPPKAHVNPLPAEITMANIDTFLGRPNTEFFDFRDVYPGESAPMLEIGWIDGFTVIPYFAFLDAEGVLDHPGTFNLADIDLDEVINEDMEYVLRNLFDPEKDLVLMCMSGARSGLMKAVLEHLGYENVWNAGGWRDYDGANKVLPWCTAGANGDAANGDDCS